MSPPERVMKGRTMEDLLKRLTRGSYENKITLEKTEECVCYYCLKIYPSKEVKGYVKDKNGYTAICPMCGIDSVLPLTKDDRELILTNLKKINKMSFGRNYEKEK